MRYVSGMGMTVWIVLLRTCIEGCKPAKEGFSKAEGEPGESTADSYIFHFSALSLSIEATIHDSVEALQVLLVGASAYCVLLDGGRSTEIELEI